MTRMDSAAAVGRSLVHSRRPAAERRSVRRRKQMHPNQLLVRFLQLGDRASFWVLALAGIAILSWQARGWAARQPRALAIEISTLLVLAALALFPPCRHAISAG